MAINANYPIPITVNGFSCRNCTDVSLAQKNIDPSHPADGPFRANADKTQLKSEARTVFDREKIEATIAAARNAVAALQPSPDLSTYGVMAPPETGRLVNLSA